MPRTASSPQLDGASARPSARLRAPSVTESTPVLFRLPAVVTAPPEPAVEPAEPETQSPVGDFQPAAAEPVVPPVPSPTAASATVDATASQNNTQTTAPSPWSATTPEAAPERSWWEHWSSGVILILLIIALITASIIAFNDSKGLPADLVVDSADETALNTAATPATGLSIPTLPAKASLANDTPRTTGEAPASVLAAQKSDDTSAKTPAAGQGSLAAAQSQTAAAQPKSSSDQSLASGSSLIPGTLDLESSGPDSPNAEAPDTTSSAATSQSNAQSPSPGQGPSGAATTASNLTSKQAAGPIVSLDLPVGIAPPTLLPPAFEAANEVSALPASQQVPAKQAGDSPTLYDGALAQPAQQPERGLSEGLSLPDFKLPAATAQSENPKPQAAEPAVGGPANQVAKQNPTPAQSVSYSTSAGAPSSPAPAAAGNSAPVANPPAGVQKTATPESDADAIIRAYQQYRAAQQLPAPAAGTPTNLPPASTPQWR